MKTTSRKRLLVSSVAMLLVAMLALGTATYAWFTQNTQATASELSAKTVKASELKVSSKNITWTDSLEYSIDKTLKPVSTVNGVNWFAAVAADKSASTATVSTAAEITDSTQIPSYAIVEQLNIQNQGGADVNNVSISFKLSETNSANSTTNYKYLRVALVPVATAGYVPSTDAEKLAYATNFASHVYASVTDSANAISSLTVDSGTGKTTAINTSKVDAINAGGDNFSVSVGTLKAYGYTPTSDTDTGTDTAYYNLYVWFEGQDTDCKDANAGNTMPSIEFTVAGDTSTMN